MSAVDPITVEVGSAPITVTVATTGLVLSIASGTVGPAGAQGPAGATGATGAQGPAGQGVPVGGTTGQVLSKASGANYDTTWTTVSGGGGGGSGTVTEVSGTAPISVASGTTTPVVSISAATTSAAGSMSSSDKAKLDGVASGATANATDAQLRDRSTHTGTQAASTITGLATVATSGAYGDLSGQPTLATIATSGSASDLSAGTVPSARLASKVVGGQDEGAGVTLSATAASLLDSTVTLPACAAGDLVIVAGSFTVLNNSTASRTYTVNLKLGATNVCAVSAGSVSNGTTRSFMFQAYVRVEGASDLNATTFVAHSLNGGSSNVANAAGVATEDIGGGSLALDLTVASSTGTATQTGTLESLTVTRIAA